MYENLTKDNVFTGILDENGCIYELKGYRKGVQVGVDMQKAGEYEAQIRDMQEVIDSQLEKLIEHGIVKIPPTAEELAVEQLRIAQQQRDEQQEINQRLLDALENMQYEIKELKAAKSPPKKSRATDEPPGNLAKEGKTNG